MHFSFLYISFSFSANLRREMINSQVLSPGQKGNVWRPNIIKHCLVIKHFTVWPPCLMMFDGIWWCFIVFELHQTFDQTTSNISFVLMFVWWCLVRLARCIKHVWLAHARCVISFACIHWYRVLFTRQFQLISTIVTVINENVVSKSNFSFLYLFHDYCNLLNLENAGEIFRD